MGTRREGAPLSPPYDVTQLRGLLRYAKRLRDKGVPPDQAEAHAEVARDFIMVELVTKTDLNEALDRWSLKLSVRLGFMLAAGIAALGVMVKLS